MEQHKLDRISELTRISRQRELKQKENTERAALRSEYLSEWKKGAEEALKSVVIVEPDGSRRMLKND